MTCGRTQRSAARTINHFYRRISYNQYQAGVDTLSCRSIGGEVMGLGQWIPHAVKWVTVTSLSGGHVWRGATVQEPLRASAEGGHGQEERATARRGTLAGVMWRLSISPLQWEALAETSSVVETEPQLFTVSELGFPLIPEPPILRLLFCIVFVSDIYLMPSSW